MVQIITAILLSLSITCFASIEGIKPKVPNANHTPGDFCTKTDPDFVELRYKERIPYCQRNVSFWRRDAIYAAYKVPANIRDQYTIDHLIPLSMGGSNDSSNLWPEHKKIKALRPLLEQQLFNQLKSGTITRNKAIAILLEAKLHPEKFIEEIGAYAY